MPNWGDILQEIQQLQQANPATAHLAPDLVRRKYLSQLHQKTQRNVIAYYSGWLSKPGLAQLEINDEDKNGFMMAVHRLDRKKGLDLILHTPGGSIAATQTIIDYLRRMFGKDMRAIIPQIAMSGGTMMACSCRSILMGKHSNLGPIDPHLRDVPARGVIEEFKRALKEVKEVPTSTPIWQTVIGKYQPTFLSQCENAIRWSDDFVRQQLREVMFAGMGKAEARRKAAAVVKRLTDYRGNRTHERHIHIDECQSMGLNIEHLEKKGNEDLQDLVLTVHHCYMHALMNSAATKIIENQNGVAFVKMVQQGIMLPQQIQIQPQQLRPIPIPQPIPMPTPSI